MIAYRLRELIRDERGQGLAEYALIITLVAVSTAGLLALLGLGIRALFETVPRFDL